MPITFEFNILVKEDTLSILDSNLDFASNLPVEYEPMIRVKHVVDSEIEYIAPSATTYIVADASHRWPEAMTKFNCIAVVGHMPGMQENPEFWYNINRSKAVATDAATFKSLSPYLFKHTIRLLDMTAVSFPYSHRPIKSSWCCYPPSLKNPIEEVIEKRQDNFLKKTYSADSTDILFTVEDRSSLWITAMASKFNLICFPLEQATSFNIDPRGASQIMKNLQVFMDSNLLGSSKFKTEIADQLEEAVNMYKSMEKFPYRKPEGTPFIIRLFNEINRSSMS